MLSWSLKYFIGVKTTLMKKVQIQWTCTRDIICVPEEIEEKIVDYQEQFLTWVDGVSFDERFEGTAFGIEEFVNYLNDTVVTKNMPKVYIDTEDYVPKSMKERQQLKKMKKLYF